MSPNRYSRLRIGAVVELIAIVAVAVALAFAVQAFVVKPYRIPTGSMEPTLAVGQRVLVDRLFGGPHVGEIAVFHPPEGAERQQCGPTPHAVRPEGAACAQPLGTESSVNFIKRIVAGPGDRIYIEGGHVYREAAGTSRFVAEPDPYSKACGVSSECNFPSPITIPTGHWFMMGDNRGDSDDSRFWGPVPSDWIIGQAIATYWPLNRIGIF